MASHQPVSFAWGRKMHPEIGFPMDPTRVLPKSANSFTRPDARHLTVGYPENTIRQLITNTGLGRNLTMTGTSRQPHSLSFRSQASKKLPAVRQVFTTLTRKVTNSRCLMASAVVCAVCVSVTFGKLSTNRTTSRRRPSACSTSLRPWERRLHSLRLL